MKTYVRQLDSLIEIQMMADGHSAIVIKKFLDFYQKAKMIRLERFRMTKHESGECGLQIVLMKPRSRYL